MLRLLTCHICLECMYDKRAVRWFTSKGMSNSTCFDSHAHHVPVNVKIIACTPRRSFQREDHSMHTMFLRPWKSSCEYFPIPEIYVLARHPCISSWFCMSTRSSVGLHVSQCCFYACMHCRLLVICPWNMCPAKHTCIFATLFRLPAVWREGEHLSRQAKVSAWRRGAISENDVVQYSSMI